MRKIGAWLAAGLISWSSVALAEFIQPNFYYEMAVGYRQDNLQWSMSGIDESPNVLWHMWWNDLKIVEYSAQASYTSCFNYTLRLQADWGKIYKGEMRASGYQHDDEHAEYSRIKSECADRGHVMDFEAGVGYQFTSNGRRVIITPLAGWAWRQQKLQSSDHIQKFDRIDIPRPHRCLELQDLNIVYKPRWYGPWIGVDFQVAVEEPCIILFGSAEYHFVQFKSSGLWNYNDIFIQKFVQHTNGHGLVAHLGFSKGIACGWAWNIVGSYRNFQASKGTVKGTFVRNVMANPQQVLGTMPELDPCSREHPKLIKVKWNSWTAEFSLDYRF